jgi:hypothetical protein
MPRLDASDLKVDSNTRRPVTVANLASRLCDQARSGQILVDSEVQTAVNELAELESVGEMTLGGFQSCQFLLD